MTLFSGALTALITPFSNNQIDTRALCELVEAQIQGGIDGLVPCGTTGESVNLTDQEYREVVRTVVMQAKGRVPIIAGAGTASTRHCIEYSEMARQEKADGLLIVAPYYNKPTQNGLFSHYKTISEQVSIPIVLYNIPGRSCVDVSIETLHRLAEFDRIVAIKEATGNVLRSQEIAAVFGDRFTILSGDDALTLPIMAVGGHGVISVTANVLPSEVAGVVHRFREADYNGALKKHQQLLPFHRAMFIETSPGPVKAALAMLGRIQPEIRLPMVMPSEASQAKIRAALDKEIG